MCLLGPPRPLRHDQAPRAESLANGFHRPVFLARSISADVSERSREIALRMALGATPGDIVRMVLRRTGTLALWGVVVGVAGSLAVTRILTKSLYDVTPTDPGTMISVVAVILVVALFAGWGPARRASRVDVMAALPAD